ncbi:MAG: murein L,D-transpeptidase catalytic domain family protein [Bacteroidetes bacterium]|nr:murein L,D-transpeptidase catalytic domain family protein [Bacteroidota bacterium]
MLFLVISLGFKTQVKLSAKAISQDKVSEIRNYLKGKYYNQDLVVFIDFKIPSNRYRFFIYDLKNSKILHQAIVSHGSGSVTSNSSDLKFSNREGSYQSSLGKYEISNSYVGAFGKSYRLKGLDRTNSNAVKRAIVLHALDCIPDVETQNPACLSLGCPMLSKNSFRFAEKYIDTSKKPLILYAFY